MVARGAASRPQGAPNVLLVVLDDVGFAQLGCFGSDIDTPTLDRLAADGLRYSNFHTTALCSPTRACVLTGRNHHAVGMGRIVDLATGFPGYDARIPTVVRAAPRHAHPARLRAPTRWASGTSRPRTRSTSAPAGTAGRSGGASSASTASSRARPTSSCRPWSTTTTTSNPPTGYDDGYHLTDGPGRPVDRVRRGPAQRRRRQAVVPLPGDRRLPLAPPGAARVDRALPRPLRRGLGRVAGGDPGPAEGGRPPARRTPSCRRAPTGCRRGPTSDRAEQRVYARYMEAFAGFLSHTDHEIGRLVDRLDALGRAGRTPSSWCCPTTAPPPRAVRSGRSTTPGCGTPCPAPSRRPTSASTRSAGRGSTTTTRGAGRWPATPRSGAGSARPTRAAWPTR